MATADWKVANRDRDTGRQLIERSAIRNSWKRQLVGVRHYRFKRFDTWGLKIASAEGYLYFIDLCCALAPPREGIKEADTS